MIFLENEVQERIEEYIKGHNVCTMALSDGFEPSAHTMYYICHGLHIYLESDPQSQKIHTLQSNPKVCLTIDEDYQDWREIRGIQLYGKAKIVDEMHAPKLSEAFSEKFPHINDFGGIPSHHIYVEIIPEKIYFMDFTKHFGHKSLLFVDEKKSILNW